MNLAFIRNFVVAVACIASAGNVVQAGSFQVAPVRVEFGAARPTTVLRVSNTGGEVVTIQAEAKAWSYSGEQDVFGDTDDVLLNPPIFTVAPGATQFVRVGLRSRAAQTAETSYRLFLEELPPPPKPDDAGVRTLLRLSLPVFVAPAGKTKPAPLLQWRMVRAGSDGAVLSATNAGTGHIQLQGISLRPQGSDAVVSKILASYLLPGQTREWKISDSAIATASEIDLTARSDTGDLRAQLVPANR